MWLDCDVWKQGLPRPARVSGCLRAFHTRPHPSRSEPRVQFVHSGPSETQSVGGWWLPPLCWTPQLSPGTTQRATALFLLSTEDPSSDTALRGLVQPIGDGFNPARPNIPRSAGQMVCLVFVSAGCQARTSLQ